ncbi:hypothetical protein LOZ52_004398 [Ophidiomyces ophidiicola]|nr:hypothetical protein LOZ55_004109 [Ophidiomyces ophidiicola]KAI1988169.1 hypothetical protein LOZ54_003332 [Ophidiomyces ophidiicola]KAI2003115.1 hypothetical protein LOZ51_000188 [Ophidiomyces ophidiicola]KAI2006212.1 hypothetical protein LOZ49_005107 [Ophidiomyces ophidiicola]KAI2017702.1 hypothetical protein LOZ46_004289 [Ophidiomyces ophidiicola]
MPQEFRVYSGGTEMSFLIDRHLIQKAADTLAYAGLAPCVSENCRSRPPSIGGSGNFANPAFHFHVPFEFEEAPVNKINTSWPSIQLHIQDERVWTLPLQYDAPVTDSNNIIFADDVRLPLPNWHPVYFNDTYKGRCRHAPGSPVRILTPERYAEALLLLKIRDQGSFAANLWQTQINYLAEYDLVNMDMVNGPTRSFMTSLLRISLRENMENARAKLGEIAMQGLMHAEWAEKYV